MKTVKAFDFKKLKSPVKAFKQGHNIAKNASRLAKPGKVEKSSPDLTAREFNRSE